MTIKVDKKYEAAKEQLEYRLTHHQHDHSSEFLRIKNHDRRLIPYFWTIALNTVGGLWTDEEAKQVECYYLNYLAKHKKHGYKSKVLPREYIELSFVASRIMDNMLKIIFPSAEDFMFEHSKALATLFKKNSSKIELTPDALEMLQTEHSDDQLQALKKLHDVLENSKDSKFKLALSMAFYSLETNEKLNSINESASIVPTNHEILLRVLEEFQMDLAKELETLFTKYFIIEQIEKYFKADYDFDPYLYMDAESIF